MGSFPSCWFVVLLSTVLTYNVSKVKSFQIQSFPVGEVRYLMYSNAEAPRRKILNKRSQVKGFASVEVHSFGFMYRSFPFTTLVRLYNSSPCLDGQTVSQLIIDCRPLHHLHVTCQLSVSCFTHLFIHFRHILQRRERRAYVATLSVHLWPSISS